MSSLKVDPSGGAELDAVALSDLAANVRGDVVVPTDTDYDVVRRVYNAMIDKRPAVVVRCAGAADVVAALAFARANALEIAVRGGGHNVSGKSVCDGGLLIDLAPMRGIRVDPERRSVRAQPGLLLRDVDRENGAFGLATPFGVVALTGIAGLTLGGGIGWLNGRFGLTCDNVLSADVVTADGRLLRASHDEHDDLYWAIRGGGGNFGIVTSFEYQAHPLDHVTVADAWYDLSEPHAGRAVVRAFDDYAASCPDEVTTIMNVALLDGKPSVKISACYCGVPDTGAEAVAPVATFGSAFAYETAVMPYVTLQGRSAASYPPGQYHYWKGSSVRSLSDEMLDVVREFTVTTPSAFTATVFQQVHGAAARVPPTATAFAHRYDHFDLVLLSKWGDDWEAEQNLAWTKDYWDALRGVVGDDVYVNNLGHDEGADRVRAAYGVNYDRLVRVKRRYDPSNVFHMNHNVVPSA